MSGLKKHILSSMRGAYNSAFSVGDGYEPQPLNTAASYDQVDRYFLDLRAKTVKDIATVVTGRGEILTASATTVAQSALGWWERKCDGEPGALERFLERVESLRSRGERREGVLLWRYDIDVPKYNLRGSWYSSMAQGQAASVLVRAYLATGDERYAMDARAAIDSLERCGRELGLVASTPGGPAFEECPSDPPSHILNGWVFTLWGLRDVALGLGLAQYMQPFEASSNALLGLLGGYDMGWWSKYSLFPGRHVDVAKPCYHTVHADQIEIMARLTGLSGFNDVGRRWREADCPRNRARAVAMKGSAFVAERFAGR